MIKDAKHYPISTLLDIEQKVIYTIPRYQREYTWSRNEWDALFDDIVENNPQYYLGSIICINQSQDALAIQNLELVDGQQRMTTLSLLLAAIYNRFQQMPDLDEDDISELRNLKHKLILKKSPNQSRLVPQVQNHNQQDYFTVLEQIGILSDVEPVPHAGNRRVLRAFRHFESRIEHFLKDKGNPIEELLELLEKINTATVVKIEVANHSDAYTLFESLNNRGVPLTAVDLIKNKLLAKLETQQAGNIDTYYNRWKKVIESLGDDYAVQERFFRQYYNAFKPELKSIHSVSVATKSNLINIYEKLIEHAPESFLNNIIRLAEHYAIILGRRELEGQTKLTYLLKSLDRIQGAPGYLLLIMLFDCKEKLAIDYSRLEQITEFLVAFFVRRNTTDVPPTRDLTRIFMGITEKLLSLQDDAKTPLLQADEVVSHIQQVLTSESASDERFRESLQGPIYEDNKAVCRFILCALEEGQMTRESKVDLWERKGKQLVWTIEHIFPQGENIPQSWVDMIADGDTVKAEEYRQEYVHYLGNLTISGYNSALSNKSFSEKQKREDSKGRSVGYNNGLFLNEKLKEGKEVTWTIDKIKKRTEELVELVINKFPLATKNK